MRTVKTQKPTKRSQGAPLLGSIYKTRVMRFSYVPGKHLYRMNVRLPWMVNARDRRHLKLLMECDMLPEMEFLFFFFYPSPQWHTHSFSDQSPSSSLCVVSPPTISSTIPCPRLSHIRNLNTMAHWCIKMWNLHFICCKDLMESGINSLERKLEMRWNTTMCAHK